MEPAAWADVSTFLGDGWTVVDRMGGRKAAARIRHESHARVALIV